MFLVDLVEAQVQADTTIMRQTAAAAVDIVVVVVQLVELVAAAAVETFSQERIFQIALIQVKAVLLLAAVLVAEMPVYHQ